MGERGKGMQMQAALKAWAELLDQVADQDFAHLFMAELHSLHQRAVEMMWIPVSGDDARTIGAGDLRHVEHQPSVLAVGGEGQLEGVRATVQCAITVADALARVEPGDAG